MGDEESTKIHNFQQKLHQPSAVSHLKQYVQWQQDVRAGKDVEAPSMGPLSVNMDLTSACNYACPHCVDMDILNVGKFFRLETIKKSVDQLVENGLKSVILIGGGEPTLHVQFQDVVRYMKEKGLQIGIVSNGTGMKKIAEIADVLDKKDWVRLSLDAGTDESFQIIHKPKQKITLYQICDQVKELTDKGVTIGFSYIAIWKGSMYKGVELLDNLDEIPTAIKLAADSGFSYFALKPCLVKLEDTKQESLLFGQDKLTEKDIALRIKAKADEGKAADGDRIKVVESTNLRAMYEGKLSEFKTQTDICHMTYFRQVMSPLGLFNCPAYRGEEDSLVGEAEAFVDQEHFDQTMKTMGKQVTNFNPCVKCKDIVCIYNRANHHIEKLITNELSFDEFAQSKDADFFL